MSSEADIKLAILNPKLYKIVKDPVQKRFQFTLEDAVLASNEVRTEPMPTKRPKLRNSIPKPMQIEVRIYTQMIFQTFLEISMILNKTVMLFSVLSSLQLLLKF